MDIDLPEAVAEVTADVLAGVSLAVPPGRIVAGDRRGPPLARSQRSDAGLGSLPPRPLSGLPRRESTSLHDDESVFLGR